MLVGLSCTDATNALTMAVAFRAGLERFTHQSPLKAPTTRAVNGTLSNKTSSGTPSPRKRATDQVQETQPKKKRKDAKERSQNDPYNPENKLVDSLRPGLTLVFIGLNPGLTTAETGRYSQPQGIAANATPRTRIRTSFESLLAPASRERGHSQKTLTFRDPRPPISVLNRQHQHLCSSNERWQRSEQGRARRGRRHPRGKD